jgi:hypothetical protein
MRHTALNIRTSPNGSTFPLCTVQEPAAAAEMKPRKPVWSVSSWLRRGRVGTAAGLYRGVDCSPLTLQITILEFTVRISARRLPILNLAFVVFVSPYREIKDNLSDNGKKLRHGALFT